MAQGMARDRTLLIWTVLCSGGPAPATPAKRECDQGSAQPRQHAAQGNFDGTGAYRIAVAGQALAVNVGTAATAGPGKPDRAHRLVRRTAVRAGNAADRHADVREAVLQRPLGHGPHHRAADRAMLIQ